MASLENTRAILAVLKLLPSDPSKMEVLVGLLNGETDLKIDDGSLSSVDLVNLMKALEQNSTINNLKLFYIPIDLLTADALAKLLGKNPNLKGLGLIQNSLNSETTQILADALEKNPTLTELGLMLNLETLPEIQILAKALEKNSHLTALSLTSNKIGPEGAFALAAMLENNSTLEKLYLNYNPLKKKGTQILVEALKNNTSLTTLNLNSSIDAFDPKSRRRTRRLDDGRVITYSLNHESDNDAQHNGVSALLKRIEENSNLTSLDLSGNRLLVGSAWSLKNQAVLVQGLISALEKNSKLTTLTLNNMELSGIAIGALEEGLKRNSTLTSLSLDNNPLLHIYGVSTILEQNSSLTHLSLKGCNLDLKSIKILAKALERNTTLRNLELENNRFGEEGAKILMEALERRSTFIDIKLSAHFSPQNLKEDLCKQTVNDFHNEVRFRKGAWQAAEHRVTKTALNENRALPSDLVNIVTDYVAKDIRFDAQVFNNIFKGVVEAYMLGLQTPKTKEVPKEKKGFFAAIKFYINKIRDGIVKLWHKVVNAIRGKEKGVVKDALAAQNLAQNANQPPAVVSDSRVTATNESAHLASSSESVTTNFPKPPKSPKTKR